MTTGEQKSRSPTETLQGTDEYQSRNTTAEQLANKPLLDIPEPPDTYQNLFWKTQKRPLSLRRKAELHPEPSLPY